MTLLNMMHNLVSAFFDGGDWRIHPDWVYCEYNYAGTPLREFNTPEENMKHFVGKMQKPGWNWGTPSVLPLPKCSDKQKFEPNCFKCKFGRKKKFANMPQCTHTNIGH